MKEFKQLAGVRKWHGDEFVTIQTEVLEPLQALVSDSGNCIISGCVVSYNGTNYVMSAGVFGCKHADGFKIVKFAQTVLPTYTGSNYLYVVKSTQTKLYDDGNVKLSANIYEGAITSVQPAVGFFIQLNNISTIMPRYKSGSLLKDNWHVVGVAGEPTFLNGFTNNSSNVGIIASDVLRFKKTVDDRVIIRGLVDFIANATGAVAGINMIQLPTGYRPLKEVTVNVNTFNAGGDFLVELIVYPTGFIRSRVVGISAGATLADIGNGDEQTPWEIEYTVN